MENNFIFPVCDVVIFENEDVITVSVGFGNNVNLPEIGFDE